MLCMPIRCVSSSRCRFEAACTACPTGLLAIAALIVAIVGPAAANYFKDEAARMPVVQYVPYLSVAIFASLITLAFVRSIGPEVAMSDLLRDTVSHELAKVKVSGTNSELVLTPLFPPPTRLATLRN